MNKVATFEKVSFEQFRENFIKYTYGTTSERCMKDMYDSIKLPTRGSKGSAGHDIVTPFRISLAPQEQAMIPTGIRCKMNKEYVMFIYPRSSLGIKQGCVLSNTTPVIDSDYYNAENEGHIFISIKNSNKDEMLRIEAGDKFVQAVFVPFGVADEEEVTTERTGGIGSTGK